MPQAGPPAAQGRPAPVPGQIPPELAHHIDPNNPIQAELVKRAGSLAPQESQAFFAGVSLQALMVLKKLLPELGFIWDRAIAAKQQQGGAPQGAPQGAPPAAQQPAPQAPPQPQAGLRRL